MRTVKAICFDLDETLLDDNTSYDLSITAACREVSYLLPRVEVLELFETYRTAADAYWLEVADDVVQGRLDGQAARLEAWRRTLHACGCSDEAVADAALAAYSRNRRETYQLFEDATALLETLRGRVGLALITNGATETQWEKVRTLGLDAYFGAIVVSGVHGIAKPDAQIFRLALDRIGISPEDAWHVGDNLNTDVSGARAAGLTAVWLNRLGRAREPDRSEPHHVIFSLSELPPLLRL